MRWFAWFRKKPENSAPPITFAELKAAKPKQRKFAVQTIQPGKISALLEETIQHVESETDKQFEEVTTTARRASEEAQDILMKSGVHPPFKFPDEPGTS